MKYYGKSPSEINQGSQEKNQGHISKKKISRMILFIDLVLVILVVIYFQQDVKQANVDRIQKSFEFSGLKVSSSCRENEGCHLLMNHLNKKESVIQKTKWSVFEKEDISPVYEVYGDIKKITQADQGSQYSDSFSFTLIRKQTVFVSFFFQDSPKDEIKFQIFP